MTELERRKEIGKRREITLIGIQKKIEKVSGSTEIDFNKIAFVMLKPGFTEKWIREILEEKFKEFDLEVVSKSPVVMDKASAMMHYVTLLHKDFYKRDLEPYITSGPCFGYIVYGENAIQKARTIACGKGGTTKDVKPDGLRFIVPNKMGQPLNLTKNVVHATGDLMDAPREFIGYVNMKAEYEMMKDTIVQETLDF